MADKDDIVINLRNKGREAESDKAYKVYIEPRSTSSTPESPLENTGEQAAGSSSDQATPDGQSAPESAEEQPTNSPGSEDAQDEPEEPTQSGPGQQEPGQEEGREKKKEEGENQDEKKEGEEKADGDNPSEGGEEGMAGSEAAKSGFAGKGEGVETGAGTQEKDEKKDAGSGNADKSAAGAGADKTATDGKDGQNDNKKKEKEDDQEGDKGDGEDEGLRGKLGKGLSEAQRAKQIAEDPRQAAEEEAKRRLKNYIKKKALSYGAKYGISVAWPVILVLLAIILIFVIVGSVASLFSISGSNTEVPQNKVNIDYIASSVTDNRLSFVNPGDLEQIKDGNISTPSLQAISYLTKKHGSIRINYSLDKEISSPATPSSPLRSNAPFEFDIAALDKIKCTDTAGKGRKAAEFDIDLTVGFNWSEYSAGKDGLFCAVGYYPKLEDKVSSAALNTYGPGEFQISEIATMGPKAALAKVVEAASEIIENHNNFRIDPEDKKSTVPTILKIPLNETDPAFLELKKKVDKANEDSDPSAKTYLISDKTMPYGLHGEFFNEPNDANTNAQGTNFGSQGTEGKANQKSNTSNTSDEINFDAQKAEIRANERALKDYVVK